VAAHGVVWGRHQLRALGARAALGIADSHLQRGGTRGDGVSRDEGRAAPPGPDRAHAGARPHLLTQTAGGRRRRVEVVVRRKAGTEQGPARCREGVRCLPPLPESARSAGPRRRRARRDLRPCPSQLRCRARPHARGRPRRQREPGSPRRVLRRGRRLRVVQRARGLLRAVDRSDEPRRPGCRVRGRRRSRDRGGRRAAPRRGKRPTRSPLRCAACSRITPCASRWCEPVVRGSAASRPRCAGAEFVAAVASLESM
jgi:hypothetical protein